MTSSSAGRPNTRTWRSSPPAARPSTWKHQVRQEAAASHAPSLCCPVLTRCLSPPGPYLGHQLLSYGQNLSFSLRLDHSVLQPSHSDLILEGGGLQVAASLGALLSAAPCREKKNYTFR